MYISDRVTSLEAEGAYIVMAKAQALEKEGRDIIHMEIGQPDFPTFPYICESGMRAIKEGHTRYNPSSGLPRLREVIAEDAGKRRKMSIRPEQVIVGPGAKPALFFPALAIVDPGDEVIYPDPGFPAYLAIIESLGAKPVPVPLVEEKNFSFDLEVFDSIISDKTKMVILNSPANPTGGLIPVEDLEHIAAKAKEHDFWIMSDEVYCRLIFDNLKTPSIAALPGMMERTIIVDGFSKNYAMTGWRLGFGIMPEALADRTSLLLNHAIGCTTTFVQIAGIEALTASQEMAEEKVREYERRRDLIIEGLNAISGMKCQKPLGTFYVFPNIKSFGIPARELAGRILNETGVALLPGTDFGPYGEGYLRLCFAVSPDNIKRALERLAGFMKNLQ